MVDFKSSVRISERPFDFHKESAQFRVQHRDAGAIVTFLGQVRPIASEKDTDFVNSLYVDHYPGFTETEIVGVAQRAVERWPVDGLDIIHRIGKIDVGDPIVWVAAAAVHRRAAFECVDFMMDYLKSEAPFWKQEVTAQGRQWITPRPEDYRDLERWSEQSQ
ncbi:MAG: molybdenum cofactor biosynthesis protein MoaE [Pseudomonadota bacterium]